MGACGREVRVSPICCMNFRREAAALPGIAAFPGSRIHKFMQLMGSRSRRFIHSLLTQECSVGRFVLLVCLGASSLVQAQVTLHVDADGSTPGSLTTIQAAADVAQAGDTVIIHAGTYRETVVPANSGTASAPIIFRANTNGGVVDEVVILGTETVGPAPSDWQDEGGGVFSTPLPRDFFSAAIPGTGIHGDLYDGSVQNQANQVFFDDEMLLVARWPNDPHRNLSYPRKAMLDDFVSRSGRDGSGWFTAVMADNDLQGQFGQNELVGAEIYFQPGDVGEWNWAFTGYVSANDGASFTLRTRGSGTDVNENNYSDESRFILYNAMVLLDTAGEWFHDKANDRLYVMPPGGINPAGRIEVKKRSFAFDLSNRSYIRLEGLRIFASTITTDTAAGGDGVPYNANGSPLFPWRNAAWAKPYDPYHHEDYNDAPSQGIVLDGLHILYPTHFTDISGHFNNQWCQSSGVVLSGKDHVMRDSWVQYSAGNGISLVGRRHRVYDNEIYDTNYRSTKCAAVHCGVTDRGSSDHEIAFNTIARSGKNAIDVSMYYSTPAEPHDWRGRVHHNDISLFAIQDGDSGAIYSGGTHRFVRVDHNWIHSAEQNIDSVPGHGNFTVGGVYPDFGSDLIIDHNVIWDVEWAIHVQTQRREDCNWPDANYLIYNNTLSVKRSKPSIVFGPFGVVTNNNNMNSICGPGTQQIAHRGTSVMNNIIFNIDDAPGYQPIDNEAVSWPQASISNNLRWDYVPGSPTDPDFTQVNGVDYQLTASSVARDAGGTIQLADRTLTVEVRGHSDTFVVPFYRSDDDGAIDQGAYQYGQSPWVAGRRTAQTADVVFADSFE